MICAYCGKSKPSSEFSCEHIWPQNLGGDVLDAFWRTNEVCKRCNNLAGVYIDAAFTKSWTIQNERTTGVKEYLSVKSENNNFVYPLFYMGTVNGYKFAEDETCEQWLGPCGANIIHFRQKDEDKTFAVYAGGDPKKSKKNNGRVYLSLTSEDEFWILQALVSVRKNFHCDRFLVNWVIPSEAKFFRNPDISNKIQAEDMIIIDAINASTRAGKKIHLTGLFDINLSTRFLSKLALGIGRQLFGSDFTVSNDGQLLIKALWERNFIDRVKIPIHGTGIFDSQEVEKLGLPLSWTGGWVLIITLAGNALSLSVVTPTGKIMTIMITNNPVFVERIKDRVNDGLIWITIPCILKAVGPISLLAYLAHIANAQKHDDLIDLESLRHDTSLLPTCGPRT